MKKRAENLIIWAFSSLFFLRMLTGGYKSTGNSQKNIRKSFGYKGFTKFQRMSNGL